MEWGVCCMKAVREQFDDANPLLPWGACGVNPAFDFEKADSPSPSVNASLGWCKEHCPGYQASTAKQWLQPLATWVIPALTLLILCSVGEDGRSKDQKWPFYSLCYQIKEYIALLGDPSSAICGAFAELWMDALMVRDLTKADTTSARVVLGVAMIANQTEMFTRDPALIFRPQLEEEKQDLVEVSKSIPQKEGSVLRERASHSESPAGKEELLDSAQTPLDNPTFIASLETGIKTLLKARADFINGVGVPVVLLLVTTGSTFHDAYLQLGENDSAHGLAYGIWYSWLIILAVLSNSYIASVNPGVANDAIGKLVDLHPRTVPLRERVRTSYDWKRWADATVNQSSSLNYTHRPAYFYLVYLLGQTLAWAMVAFVCSCAAAISYSTPTIGIGCRSFTFMLYGALSFVLAWLMVLRTWIASRPTQGRTQKPLTAKVLQYVYATTTIVNAFVLVFSTIAQLVGLFRSCLCTHFGSLSDPIELSTGTELSIHKAKVTWLPVGFVAYTGVWIVCVIAVGFRMFNNYRTEKLMG
ncbi:uncharacterized protein KY384_005755 [Bacidia gigantensis]|uniref:uncharacterized protein n=1 Tax=Bacidia gigantensis TaxID=2732470 RepID=UPI001D05B6D7|nr:uncharacterized protein KY384_005755 [Bacidia gigantensis]KAG8529120.1 hypothetical protein KY384_005755 [Bacidia gigantensis]